ncbi:MAG: phosphatidylinositol-specific phospholipase C1-like protein [Acidobacteriaceae bacterium]
MFRTASAIALAACFTGSVHIAAQTVAANAEDSIRMNQIQVIGTHNSYHAGFAPSAAKYWKRYHPDVFKRLDYKHAPLDQQLSAGVRQIELDVFADRKGGLYAQPAGENLVAKAGLPADSPFDPKGLMQKPGFKVMHQPDVDYRSTCQPFVACLQVVRQWSMAHPQHVPIFILIETRQGKPESPGRTTPEPFTPETFDALDAEIRSVFTPDQMITPDDVRGDYATLNQAIRHNGWPTLAQARGKVIFLMDRHDMTPVYLEGHRELHGRVLFTNSTPGDSEAAFVEQNEPNIAKIRELVQQGYLVRTRTDESTVQGRTGNTIRRTAALASGAQMLSTDYPASEPARWIGSKGKHYTVELPHNVVARCNPVLKPARCIDAVLEPKSDSEAAGQ